MVVAVWSRGGCFFIIIITIIIIFLGKDEELCTCVYILYEYIDLIEYYIL